MLGFVEPVLFEQGTAEDDLRVADLVQEVRAPLEQLERVAGLLFGQAPVAGSEMNLCKRRDRLRCIRVATDLERNGERTLEIRDRVVGLAEQEVQAAEVVEHSAEVLAVAVRLVELLRAFGERARPEPLAIAFCDERCLESDVRNRQRVVESLCKLQRALDVLARGFEIALTARAA